MNHSEARQTNYSKNTKQQKKKKKEQEQAEEKKVQIETRTLFPLQQIQMFSLL